MKSAAFLLAASSCVSGVVLTDDNFSDLTAGKTVFVKFYAPWCGHCKAMAPAWEKLMDEYNSNAQIVVGEADCTGAGAHALPDIQSFCRLPLVNDPTHSPFKLL